MLELFLSLVVIVFLFSFIAFLFFSLATGGPYSPSANWKVNELLKIIKNKKIKRAADIGSGDGRIVIALAKMGIEAHGYEINPILVYYSRLKIKRLGLQKKAHIHMKNLWSENFGQYDLVTAYLSFHVMGALTKKLWEEMKPGSLVITHLFKLPKVKPIKEANQLYVYQITKK